jgi:hypothetical protein
MKLITHSETETSLCRRMKMFEQVNNQPSQDIYLVSSGLYLKFYELGSNT